MYPVLAAAIISLSCTVVKLISFEYANIYVDYVTFLISLIRSLTYLLIFGAIQTTSRLTILLPLAGAILAVQILNKLGTTEQLFFIKYNKMMKGVGPLDVRLAKQPLHIAVLLSILYAQSS
jgi:hypothetical protein